jgi:hypothetical protein
MNSVRFTQSSKLFYLTHCFQGHVLGLVHEHQRKNAESYLSYKCENVNGYDEARKKAEAKRESMDDVCKSAGKCIKYSFCNGATRG